MFCLAIVSNASGRCKVFCWPPQQTDQRCILSWSCYCEGMRLPLRGGELERKLVLGLTQSHLYLSVQCCLGEFFALVKNKDKPQGDGESGQYLIRVWEQRGHLTPCDILFPQVITASLSLFPARLHESLLSPCPPIFNSFSSCLGGEGGGLNCCVQGCFCCCSLWSWMMEVEELSWCEFRKWQLGQTTTKELLGEKRPPATFLAVGITSFYRDRAGEHPWSVSEWRPHPWPRMGWWAQLQLLECSLKGLYWQCVGSTQGCCSQASYCLKLWWRHAHATAPSGLNHP